MRWLAVAADTVHRDFHFVAFGLVRHRATVSTIVLIFMSLLIGKRIVEPDYADHSSAAWRTRQLAIRRPQSYPSRLKCFGILI